MLKKELLNLLCCPDCHGNLIPKKNKLVCNSCQEEYTLMKDIPILIPKSMPDDVKLSQQKWDWDYKVKIDKKNTVNLKKAYELTYSDPEFNYIGSIFRSFKNKKYLEIGCGTFFVGQRIAKLGSFAVGIDYSINALKLAKFYLENEGIKNYLLVCGDISKMPFKDNTFDLIYGGGVLEHFKNTLQVVKENYRVLKKGGIAFNTVPQLNLGSLTYRQIWGNIPYAPILKQLAEFVHLKLLKGRRMIYGYEYSFTKSKIKDIFRKAKFLNKNMEVANFRVPLLFEYIRVPIFRKIAILLASSNLFWPVIYIKAKKKDDQ